MTVFYTKCYDKFTRVHVFLLPYNLLGYTIANQNLFQNIVSRTTSVVFSYLNGFVVLASLPFFQSSCFDFFASSTPPTTTLSVETTQSNNSGDSKHNKKESDCENIK